MKGTMEHIELAARECRAFGERLRDNPYRLLLGEAREQLYRWMADDNTPPVVVLVPVGRKSGPAAFEGMEYSLHRMRLVFRSAVASRRPRRIPSPPDSDVVRQALDDAIGRRRTPRVKARLDELVELVQRLGRYGLIELARERGAPDLASFKEDLWGQLDAFMPHAVLIDDDRLWLAACNEVRAGNMAHIADFLSPPPVMGRPVRKIDNECIAGLIGLAAQALARKKERVSLARAAALVQEWQLRVELEAVRKKLRKGVCPKGEIPTGRELLAVASEFGDKLPSATEEAQNRLLRKLLAEQRMRVPNAARLLLLGLPLWSPGGLHRHILSTAGLRKECEGGTDRLENALVPTTESSKP